MQEAWLNNFSATVVPDIQRRKAGGKLFMRQFRIGGRLVRVFSTTPRIAEEFAKSFLHLEVSSTESAELDIHVWEREDMGAHRSAPLMPDSEADEQSHLIYQLNEHCISIYDRSEEQAYFWIDSLAQLGDWHRAKPFRSIVHWFLSQHGLSMIHGAVVGTAAGAVLITAKGGSGKTTTALACFLNGMDYLSDDYVAIDCENKTAYSLFNSAMLTDDNLERFPMFRPYVGNTERPLGIKALVHLQEIYPERLRQQAPLLAILIPRITHSARTEIVPTGRMSALMAIAPTIRSLRNYEQEKLSAAKLLAEGLPCFELRLGTDMQEVANTVMTFIDSRHE